MLDVELYDDPRSAYRLRREPIWLPAGLLAAVMLLTLTAGALGGEGSLQWRADGAKPNPASSRTSPNPLDKRPSPGRVSRARWVDPKVRAVAYDEPSTRFAQRQNNDDLLKEFSKPMGKQVGGETPNLFEDLPPKSDTPSFDDPPTIEPPLIEPEADTSPARPEFDPFDDRPAAPSDAGSGTRGSGTAGSGSRGAGTQGSGSRLAPPTRNTGNDQRRDQERAEAFRDCAEELAKLRASNLTMVDITIDRSGVEGEDFPYVCSIDDGIPLAQRSWAPITYTWKAAALCHKPLYFEQEQLERYGHSWGPVMQPLVSGAHFFGHLAVLPYSMGLKAPNECVYALGHYRPGSCAPYLIPAVPFTWRAAAFQGAFATGAAFVIP